MPLYDVSISVLLYVKTYTGWDACVQKKTSLLSRLEFQFYKQFQEAEIIPGSKMVPHSIKVTLMLLLVWLSADSLPTTMIWHENYLLVWLKTFSFLCGINCDNTKSILWVFVAFVLKVFLQQIVYELVVSRPVFNKLSAILSRWAKSLNCFTASTCPGVMAKHGKNVGKK